MKNTISIKMKFITIIVLLLIPNLCFSQADMNMSTHWNNRGNYNPASIARPDYLYIFSNARAQWLGVNGAPKTINVQVSDYYVPLHSAFGLSIVTDNIGLTSYINPLLSYAYQINAENDWSLALGVSAGVFSRNIDLMGFEPNTVNDIKTYNLAENTLQPDVNIGFEFQNKNFILGAATTHVLAKNNSNDQFFNSQNYYGYAIYKNQRNEFFHYFLEALITNRDNFTIVEGNASIRFRNYNGTNNTRDIFELGLGYRSSKIAIFSMGIYISDTFKVGYAYDKNFISGYGAQNTHEIMLEYRIPMASSSPCNTCKNQSWYR